MNAPHESTAGAEPPREIGGAIMVIRPVVDPTTGRTETVRFHVDGRELAPTDAELARLVDGTPVVVVAVPSRHRAGVSLVGLARADAHGTDLPPSCVLVTSAGQRLIVVGTLVIVARDASGAIVLPSPAEILDIEYSKIGALPYPLLRIRHLPSVVG